jgi:hypothetical protein
LNLFDHVDEIWERDKHRRTKKNTSDLLKLERE